MARDLTAIRKQCTNFNNYAIYATFQTRQKALSNNVTNDVFPGARELITRTDVRLNVYEHCLLLHNRLRLFMDQAR